MATEPDVIDRMITAWRTARPDLDPSPLELVGRVIVLAQYLEKSVQSALAAHGLTLGEFDILATLRRHPGPGGLTPTWLLKSVMLSSGGMTSRLDKLERLGLIVRKADPDDRRGVVVELTAKGRRTIDQATATRFTDAAEALPLFSAAERKLLSDLLRRWLNVMTDPADESA